MQGDSRQMRAGADAVGVSRLRQPKCYGTAMIEPHKVMRLRAQRVGLMTENFRRLRHDPLRRSKSCFGSLIPAQAFTEIILKAKHFSSDFIEKGFAHALVITVHVVEGEIAGLRQRMDAGAHDALQHAARCSAATKLVSTGWAKRTHISACFFLQRARRRSRPSQFSRRTALSCQRRRRRWEMRPVRKKMTTPLAERSRRAA